MSKKSNTRIAIVDQDKCQPNKCKHECKKFCPVNAIGKKCVEIETRIIDGKKRPISNISEELCISCGICTTSQKGCPFGAIKIINLPHALDKIIYRYGNNSFKIHNLPMPKKGAVLGLIGANGCGKTTCLQILSDVLMPNFGNFDEKNGNVQFKSNNNLTPKQNEIIKYYRGSELQNYFNELYRKTLKIVTKPQSVELYIQSYKGNVMENIKKINTLSDNDFAFLSDKLALKMIENKLIETLSGGESQTFAIAMTLVQKADVYMFDEPSSYLDIKQRINMAEAIRHLLVNQNKYIIVIEHDLSVLDYLSDNICMLYGKAGVYGVVSVPYSVREGINMYLDGYITAENMRFRPDSLNFRFTDANRLNVIDEKTIVDTQNEEIKYTEEKIIYPSLTKLYKSFKLEVQGGEIKSSQITVLVGSNGTGKTTFIKMLCGLLVPDNKITIPELKVSYKPQKIEAKFEGTVQELFNERISSMFHDKRFYDEIVKPLNIDHLLDHKVKTLSGGEAQRVAIILTLGKPAEVYLIDEPSAYLDVEQRLVVAKIIKKFIIDNKKYCFLVEHDFIMSTYLADKIIVFEKNGEISNASTPYEFVQGFNQFLKILGVTFRRDLTTYRPRINKLNSQNDKMQKIKGEYFTSEPLINIESSHIIKETPQLDW